MVKSETVLTKQDPTLKVIICLLLVIITSLIDFSLFLVIFGFSLLYFIVQPNIYTFWLTTLLKILPFFISFYVFSILFNLPFPNQLHITLRICYLLLISVFLVNTTAIDSFISSGNKKSTSFAFKFEFLLAATIHFIPIFISKFKQNKASSTDFSDSILRSFDDCVNEIDQVEHLVIDKINTLQRKTKKELFPQIYLLLLIIVPVFLIIFNRIGYEKLFG
ncbi:MAG: energy-coupling factor transporter transmembrane protein EcfT [Candidatus Cloacimonetes bacterium]|nr:energy-coupling factor transporter transmembrane protein EcfT [Candidatus Cloacimonadota bacterium]